MRRLRSGPSGGSWPLAVLAAAALVAALVAVGRSLDGPAARPSAQPPPTTAATPYRIDGRVVCPLARPVLAASDGRSYPPGHPAQPPPGAGPVACHDTVAEAEAAGYARAALPAGTVELDGVYLLPTSDGLRGRCRRAAERLGLAVPCPTVLPAFSPGAPPPTVCEDRRPCEQPASGFLLEATGFLVPSGYVGAYWETGARLAIAAARWPGTSLVACAGERPLATTGVRGTRGRLFECAPGAGPHGGDGLLLRWRERGVVIALGVSGRTASFRRLLVRGLAAHLELVPPGG